MGIQQMMMSAAELDAYLVKRSTRFNDDDSAYLNRTFSQGNQRTWTWSGWVKRGVISSGSIQTLMQLFPSGLGYTRIYFETSGELYVDATSTSNGNSVTVKTIATFRDPGAWYHICVAMDTTQSTEADRLKMYVNGVQQTSFSPETYPAQNVDYMFNHAATHNIGRHDADTQYFDGLISEVNFVDGAALDHTSFGETNATTGQWIPKAYTHVASPNDGTTWSSGTVTESEGSGWYSGHTPAYGFNNNITTDMKTQNASTITFTPASGIPYTSSVEIYQDRVQTGATINGSAVTTPGTANAWNTLITGSSGVLTSLTVTNDSSTVIAAIRIDGKQLIDGLSGDNSFHLAMDPAESGANYSGNIEISSSASGATLGQAASKGFNGTVSDWYEVSVSTGGQAIVNYNGTLTGVTTLEFYGGTSASGSDTITVTGTGVSSTVITSMGSTKQSITVTNSTVSNLTFTVSGANNFRLAGLYVNGKLLVDHTAIGNDSSGQKNHWYENNLLTTAINDGTTWSNQVTGTEDSGWEITQMFDSTLTNSSRASAGNSLTFTPSPTISNINSLRIKGRKTGTGSLTVNGTSYDSLFSSSYEWKPIPVSSLSTVVWNNVSGSNGTQFDIMSIEINGTVLLDGQDDSSGIDLLSDAPGAPYDNELNGGGNYCTLNPLENGLTLSNGNLLATNSGTWKSCLGTQSMNSGKWYFEFTLDSGNHIQTGICGNGTNRLDNYLESDATAFVLQSNNGTLYTGSSGSVSSGFTYTTNDVVNFAYDADTTSIWVGKNGTWYGDPAAGTGALYTSAGPGSTGRSMLPGVSVNSASCTLNFGARSFIYTPPTGYKALNTYNLTAPDFKPSTVFESKIYLGTQSTSPKELSYEFGPDLFWSKRRDASNGHQIYDRVRGDDKYLQSDSSNEEDKYGADSGACTFGTDKVTLATNRSNENAVSYASWAWDAGTADTSPSVGSLNSSMYDQSATWSSTMTSGSGAWYNNTFTAARAFDGVVEDTYAEATSNTITWAQVGLSWSSSLEVWCASTNMTAAIDGGGSVNLTAGQWTTVASGEGSISTSLIITHTGTTANVKGIRKDGKLLVDSGVTLVNVPSIASTYRANPTAGFSCVSYTGSGSTDTIGHGLNDVPKFIITKNRDDTFNWGVYHASAGPTVYLKLNLADKADTQATWQNTAPTSSVFYVGNYNSANQSDDEYIAYIWSEVAGYSKFSSYTGTGTSDNYVHCGFAPSFLIIKRTTDGSDGDTTYGGWIMLDNKRTGDNDQLFANCDQAEGGRGDCTNVNSLRQHVDFLSTGFVLSSGWYETNDTVNYIFAAWAEAPFRYANAR